MLPIIKKPPISNRRKGVALGIAGAADLLQIALLPALGFAYVLDDAIDVVAALILVIVCGFKWQFVLAFLLELVPGLDLFPTWTAVVLTIPAAGPDTAESAASPTDPSRVMVTRVPPVQSSPETSVTASLPPAGDH